jgi:hypothetical protein
MASLSHTACAPIENVSSQLLHAARTGRLPAGPGIADVMEVAGLLAASRSRPMTPPSTNATATSRRICHSLERAVTNCRRLSPNWHLSSRSLLFLCAASIVPPNRDSPIDPFATEPCALMSAPQRPTARVRGFELTKCGSGDDICERRDPFRTDRGRATCHESASGRFAVHRSGIGGRLQCLSMTRSSIGADCSTSSLRVRIARTSYRPVGSDRSIIV